MAHENQIKLAIEEIHNSDAPNITAIAKKYDIDRSTLSRRVRGVTRSRKDATSDDKKHLTEPQEMVLLDQIAWLNNKGIHPTPRIIRNMVERSLGHSIGHNWVTRFQQRYSDRITGIYLRGFDRDRKHADNPDTISHFYSNVRL
jgi:hypothetical protein